ncbi:type II toxin-antitoxin system RelE/ParE family toxin [Desulfoplanes sp.]
MSNGGILSLNQNRKLWLSRWGFWRPKVLKGPELGFPHSSGVNGSQHNHMRELRTVNKGKPLRTLYAFDPRRTAILLIGGDKTGDKRWYEVHIPVADRLYDEHLTELAEEDRNNG